MQQQDAQTTLLEEVYQSAAMGERGAELMLGKSQDNSMTAKLSEFRSEYASIKEEAAERLAHSGKQPKEIGPAKTTAQWMGVQLGTLTDKSSARMAEVLIEGSTKKLIKNIEDIKHNPQASHETRKLAGRLVKLEDDSLTAMRTYLN